ncbi:Hemolysin-type calcium-binding region [Thalassoporum mexicanum PCC 7367]|uniref:calcium-binding protein n=1 Tax=Thalassoporum mexicanum TaxID=3457544 RepID=UPI00029FD289|nr:calcium-binding protein [Pseudanabaena sp. PCC 7367]AFY69854.1 Hemolysin-type calcium-binding region [Pseudanabaena sp. PCC 7367]
MAIINNSFLLSSYELITQIANSSSFFFDLSDLADDLELRPEFTIDNPAGIRGFNGSDTIVGSSGDDVVNGNQGSDFLFGSTGNDYLRGGKGDDELVGEFGNNVLNGNIGDDLVLANNGANFLRGGQGNDFLSGGIDDDILIGDFGTDLLVGAGGADTFVLRADTAGFSIDNADQISDLNLADGDRIVIVGNFSFNDIGLFSARIQPGFGFPVQGTVIERISTGEILGTVTSSIQDVELALELVSTSDPALFIG